MNHSRKAFSLIELLVVVVILSLLVAVILPTFARARELARRGVCSSNLSQLGKGVFAYAANHESAIPIYGTGWDGQILPYFLRRFYTDVEETAGSGSDTYHPTMFWYLGKLWRDRYIREDMVYYCPSQRDINYMHKTYATPRFPTKWELTTGQTTSPQIRNGFTYNPRLSADRLGHIHNRLTDFKMGTILAMDLLYTPEAIAHGPQASWNILSGDGSVVYVESPKVREIMEADELGFALGGNPAAFDEALEILSQERR
jgi:prepilin-type N-terminal cleavage/methylation domain-containing protein